MREKRGTDVTMTHELPGWVTDGLSNLTVKRELPKWPVLTVTGQDVSPALGREICIRTTDPSRLLPSLGEEWGQQVCAAYGIRENDHLNWLPYEDREHLRGELGILDLEYLGNDRVTASRGNRPSGWCDWSGAIGTTGTDLDDKWPSLNGLNQELGLIAGTWPELTMAVQLSSYKTADEPFDLHPFLTWDVEHGSAVLRREPGALICPVVMPWGAPAGLAEECERERGCDTDTLVQAISEVKSKISQ